MQAMEREPTVLARKGLFGWKVTLSPAIPQPISPRAAAITSTVPLPAFDWLWPGMRAYLGAKYTSDT
jgi:hypothetical protein